jgi:hypothetical protein
MNGEDFSWRDDRDSIVIAEQLAIAIHQNPSGYLVIRQEDCWDDDDDVIIVAKTNVPALCRALYREAGLGNFPVALLPAPKSRALVPKPVSAGGLFDREVAR